MDGRKYSPGLDFSFRCPTRGEILRLPGPPEPSSTSMMKSPFQSYRVLGRRIPVDRQNRSWVTDKTDPELLLLLSNHRKRLRMIQRSACARDGKRVCSSIDSPRSSLLQSWKMPWMHFRPANSDLDDRPPLQWLWVNGHTITCLLLPKIVQTRNQ